MKKILFQSLFAVSVLVSCEKKNIENAQTDTRKEVSKDSVIKKEFSVDSLSVEDSMKISNTLTSGFKSKILIFPSITDRPMLDSIYKNTGLSTDDYSRAGLMKALDRQKLAQFDSTKAQSGDYMPEYKQTWDNINSMKLVSNTNGFLTLRYNNYGYIGGAHGYESETYKVFDLKENKVLKLEDIVSLPEKEWGTILLASMKKNVPKEQQEMLLVDKITANDNFYFDDRKLYFVYNQYEIAAYAAGRITIPVTWEELSTKLKSSFKTRMNIR